MRALADVTYPPPSFTMAAPRDHAEGVARGQALVAATQWRASARLKMTHAEARSAREKLLRELRASA